MAYLQLCRQSTLKNVLSPWVAHVAPIAPDDKIFLVASKTDDQAIFNWKDRVLHTVDDEKFAARVVQYSRCKKTELTAIERVSFDYIRATIAKLIRQCFSQCERIFHLILSAYPCGVEHVVAASALCYSRKETIGVSVRDPHSIIATRTDTPS